jgi:cytochrome c5
MKWAFLVVFLVLPPLSWSEGAQQPESKTLDHLIVLDKQAVEEWGKATQGKEPLDARTPLETEFLLSLTPTERLGAFRFKQRCTVCHGRQMSLQPNTWGPILTKKNVDGREDIVRRQIAEGSQRMPAFKYALQPEDIDAIVQYLKKVDTVPM